MRVRRAISDLAARAALEIMILVGRVLGVTIWRSGLFGIPPDRYANVYRIVLPGLYVSLLYSGIAAIRFGSPAFSDFTRGNVWALIWGTAVTAAALLCLVGIAFPRALYLEAVGGSVIATALGIYLIVLVVLTGQGSEGRALVAGISTGALMLALWRLADIRTEVRKRRRDRARIGETADLEVQS